MAFRTQIHKKKFGKNGFRTLQWTMSHRPLSNTSSLKITAAYCTLHVIHFKAGIFVKILGIIHQASWEKTLDKWQFPLKHRSVPMRWPLSIHLKVPWSNKNCCEIWPPAVSGVPWPRLVSHPLTIIMGAESAVGCVWALNPRLSHTASSQNTVTNIFLKSNDTAIT